jgi:hypothetical protein
MFEKIIKLTGLVNYSKYKAFQKAKTSRTTALANPPQKAICISPKCTLPLHKYGKRLMKGRFGLANKMESDLGAVWLKMEGHIR